MPSRHAGERTTCPACHRPVRVPAAPLAPAIVSRERPAPRRAVAKVAYTVAFLVALLSLLSAAVIAFDLLTSRPGSVLLGIPSQPPVITLGYLSYTDFFLLCGLTPLGCYVLARCLDQMARP